MKRKLSILLAALLMLSMTCLFAACGDNDSADGDDAATEASADIEEMEQPSSEKDGSVIKVQTPTKNFYGTWTADSAKAEYLYGKFKIVIKKDGTWTGDINDEKLQGTWEEVDFGIHLYEEELDWGCDLFYTAKGNFVLEEDELDFGKVVLTKHEDEK